MDLAGFADHTFSRRTDILASSRCRCLTPAIFHARQHRHQRQIDFFVHVHQASIFYFFAQRPGDATGNVGGFRR